MSAAWRMSAAGELSESFPWQRGSPSEVAPTGSSCIRSSHASEQRPESARSDVAPATSFHANSGTGAEETLAQSAASSAANSAGTSRRRELPTFMGFLVGVRAPVSQVEDACERRQDEAVPDLSARDARADVVEGELGDLDVLAAVELEIVRAARALREPVVAAVGLEAGVGFDE